MTNEEKKQTAAEWLFEQIWITPKDKLNWNTLLNRAKEMEKQQIVDALNYFGIEMAEQYYNETFNQD